MSAGRGAAHQILQLPHGAGLHHLGGDGVGAAPAAQRSGFSRGACRQGVGPKAQSLEAMEARRKRISRIKGNHHQGRYSLPRRLGQRSGSRATDSGLAQRADGGLPTFIRVAMKPALMIRTANGLQWQRSSNPSHNAVRAALATP